MHLSGSRLVVAGTALLVLLAAALAGWAALRPHPTAGTTPAGPAASAAAAAVAPRAPARPGTGRAGAVRAVAGLTLLADWDRARASAWARGDPEALAALYVPGARAGESDVAMLRRWRARGLRVHGMSQQVLAVELRARTARRVVLVVTDRLVGAVAVPGMLPLPRDRPSTRRLDFRREGGRWLLASSVEVSRGPGRS